MKINLIGCVLLLVVCTVLTLAPTINSHADDLRECKEHGLIREVVTINFWGEDYELCGKCVMELISNNMDEVGRMIKNAKEAK